MRRLLQSSVLLLFVLWSQTSFAVEPENTLGLAIVPTSSTPVECKNFYDLVKERLPEFVRKDAIQEVQVSSGDFPTVKRFLKRKGFASLLLIHCIRVAGKQKFSMFLLPKKRGNSISALRRLNKVFRKNFRKHRPQVLYKSGTVLRQWYGGLGRAQKTAVNYILTVGRNLGYFLIPDHKCGNDSNCYSDRYCSGSIPNVCKKRLSEGQTCFRQRMCQSGLRCYDVKTGSVTTIKDGRCRRGRPSVRRRPAVTFKSLGEQCQKDTQCLTQKCDAVRKICVVKPGESCAHQSSLVRFKDRCSYGYTCNASSKRCVKVVGRSCANDLYCGLGGSATGMRCDPYLRKCVYQVGKACISGLGRCEYGQYCSQKATHGYCESATIVKEGKYCDDLQNQCAKGLVCKQVVISRRSGRYNSRSRICQKPSSGGNVTGPSAGGIGEWIKNHVQVGLLLFVSSDARDNSRRYSHGVILELSLDISWFRIHGFGGIGTSLEFNTVDSLVGGGLSFFPWRDWYLNGALDFGIYAGYQRLFKKWRRRNFSYYTHTFALMGDVSWQVARHFELNLRLGVCLINESNTRVGSKRNRNRPAAFCGQFGGVFHF